MAITPTIRATQGTVLATSAGKTDATRVTQGFVLAPINFPSLQLRTTQGVIYVAAKPTTTLRLTQATVLAAVRGRIENRRMRAWTFSLDGHDFYVLRLGEAATLVLDLTSGQWSEWKSADWDYWTPHLGMNWLGMAKTSFDRAEGYNTNVVAGDDNFGLLWILDATQQYDDAPLSAWENDTISCVTMGGVSIRGREAKPCNGIYITMSLGNPATVAAAVTLRTSDDWGRTWDSHGAVTIEAGNYNQEVSWTSLGTMFAPGRVFEVSDNGAAVRINSVVMT